MAPGAPSFPVSLSTWTGVLSQQPWKKPGDSTAAMLGRPPRNRGSLQLRSLPIWAPDLCGQSPAPDIAFKARGNTHQRQSSLAEPSQPVGPPLLTLEDSGCFEPVGLGVTWKSSRTVRCRSSRWAHKEGGAGGKSLPIAVMLSGKQEARVSVKQWAASRRSWGGGGRERGRRRESSRQRKSGVITWWQGKTLHLLVFHLHSLHSLYYVIFHSPWSGWVKGLQKNSSQKETDLKVRTREVREHSRLHSTKRRSAPSFAHLPNRLKGQHTRHPLWAVTCQPSGDHRSVPSDAPPIYFQDDRAGKKKRPHCLSWKGSVGICISSGGSHWSQATKKVDHGAVGFLHVDELGWSRGDGGLGIMRQGPGRDKEWGAIVGHPWIRIQ